MKNKIKLMLGFLLSAIILINIANAEIYLWTDTIKDYDNNIVNYHSFYQFLDTSAENIGKNKDVPITFHFQVEELPYNLTYGEVDWCNFTITHRGNIYDGNGDFLNSTLEIQNYYFESSPSNSSYTTINMQSRDVLFADMKCHYTDNQSLYEDGILVGSYATFLPSFECSGCTQYTLEQLSQETKKNENITANELAIYSRIQTAIDWNYQIWVIFSYIIKIIFIFVAVGLVFAGVYYFYVFLKNIAKEI